MLRYVPIMGIPQHSLATVKIDVIIKLFEVECAMQHEGNMKQKNLIFFIICMVAFLCIGCKADLKSNETKLFLNAETAQYEIIAYETVPDDFSIKIVNIGDLLNDRIVGVVYFGRDSCPFCLTLNGILKSEIDRNSNIIVYKFDTDEWRSNPQFQNVLDKYMIQSIPALIRINADFSVEQFIPDEEKNETEIRQALRLFLIGY